jgi:hypothetical protein
MPPTLELVISTLVPVSFQHSEWTVATKKLPEFLPVVNTLPVVKVQEVVLESRLLQDY